MNKVIEITIRNKVARIASSPIIVGKNKDYIVRFDFDEDWDKYDTKTARFSQDGEYQDIIFAGNECSMPALDGGKVVEVGVYAGDISTTSPAYLTVQKSIIDDDGVPADPTPDVYAQLMERLNELEAPAAVLYTEQNLTNEQKAQARDNIGVNESLGMTGATVGQVPAVKSVDENGAPTEWGAVEFPEQVQSDWEQTDETAADYLKNRPFGNVAYDGIFFKRVPGGYNLVRVPDFNALAEIQGTRKAEIRRYGDVVNTGSADVSVSDYDGSISIKYTSAQTIIRFSGSYGTLNSINVQQDSGISNEGEYVLHIDGLYYEGYIKLSADKVEGTLPSASAADCVLISTGSGNNWRATKISTDFPLASATGRGAVKVGDGLSISSDGKLSVDMSGLDTKSLGLTGATVGQIIKIKSVNASGNPTEWEAVDFSPATLKTWTEADLVVTT